MQRQLVRYRAEHPWGLCGKMSQKRKNQRSAVLVGGPTHRAEQGGCVRSVHGGGEPVWNASTLQEHLHLKSVNH
jgi:hypothetical protein